MNMLGLAAAIVRQVWDYSARELSSMLPPSGDTSFDDQWDGPDDIWPSKEDAPAAERSPEVQTTVIAQWGLRLPDDTIAWDHWQGIPFNNPLDRIRLIATLQKTALNVGFAEGDQIVNFLGNYSWVVREATVTTQYSSAMVSHGLGDPAAAEISPNGKATEIPPEEGVT